jgi:hypothetical protein
MNMEISKRLQIDDSKKYLRRLLNMIDEKQNEKQYELSLATAQYNYYR